MTVETVLFPDRILKCNILREHLMFLDELHLNKDASYEFSLSTYPDESTGRLHPMHGTHDLLHFVMDTEVDLLLQWKQVSPVPYHNMFFKTEAFISYTKQ